MKEVLYPAKYVCEYLASRSFQEQPQTGPAMLALGRNTGVIHTKVGAGKSEFKSQAGHCVILESPLTTGPQFLLLQNGG